MKKNGRYDISGLAEAQFEPGSRGRVLKNLLGITRKREMDEVEAKEHIRAMEELAAIYDKNHRFTARDICMAHKIWLGGVYAWAGRYRQVNISKGGFLFAAASQVPQLMVAFEKGPLQEYTPCRFSSKEAVIKAVAIVHAELVLIHPFREGNGRLARLVSVLMALQAGLPPLDFKGIKGEKRREYFGAVQAGLDRDYAHMGKIFTAVVDRTLRVSGKA